MTRPRLLVFGAWDDGPGYPRARSLFQGLTAAGDEPALWRLPSPLAGQTKIAVVRRPWRWPGAACRLLAARVRARRELQLALATVRPDVVIVPYPGHVLVPVVREAFTGPIVLDLFLSAHDTVVADRGYFRPRSWPARALRALDRRACRAADLVLLDTPLHAASVADECGLPETRFGWLPVGDPDAPPVAPPYVGPAPSAPLQVLFFGTGVPLHGLDVLVDAADRCAGVVRLEVVGGSRAERAAIAARASPHVDLGPAFVDRDRLAVAIARAHLIAGVFGTSGKAQRVIPFKVVHGLAAGRPVLTGDTAAVRAWLRPGEDVLVAPVGDASALAARLLAVADARQALPGIAAAARAAYERRFAPAALGAQWDVLLRRLRPAPSAREAPLPQAVARV